MVEDLVGVNGEVVEFRVAVVVFDTGVENVGATEVLDSEIRRHLSLFRSVSN